MIRTFDPIDGIRRGQTSVAKPHRISEIALPGMSNDQWDLDVDGNDRLQKSVALRD
jgi:hypothetical protein